MAREMDVSVCQNVSDAASDFRRKGTASPLNASASEDGSDAVLDFRYKGNMEIVKITRSIQPQYQPDYIWRPVKDPKATLRSRSLTLKGKKVDLVARLYRHPQPPKTILTVHNTFPFLKLLPELRNMVYKELFTLQKSRTWEIGHAYPEIICTSREVYSQITKLFLAANRLDICIGDRGLLSAGGMSFNISCLQHIRLPQILYKCENIKIRLNLDNSRTGSLSRLFVRELHNIVKHLNLVVNPVLQGNTCLRSVYLELCIAREGYLKQPMVSDATMLELEQSCVDALKPLRLPPLPEVPPADIQLMGFGFDNQAHIDLIKQEITQTRIPACMI